MLLIRYARFRRRARRALTAGFLCGCGAGWQLSCTSPAEHSNPLDPQSPFYTTNGRFAGVVTSFYQPYRPLSGAMVQVQPAGLATSTDGQGEFFIDNLAPGVYTAIASAAGYAADTASIEVIARQSRRVEFRLDGLPVAQSPRVVSAHVSTRESPTDQFFMEITAELSDPDGANDIKKVVAQIPSTGFADTLSRGAGPSRWQRVFAPEELAGIDLFNLTGAPFQLVAEDFPGERATSEAFFLTRVIAEVPLAVSPADGVNLQIDSPTFIWQLAPIPFNHTLRVDVFRLVAGFPTFIAAIGNIAAGSASVKYPGRLASANYYWTVKLIDDFGNSSRSKEATFSVQ
jgi:hypothetical protein